MAIGTGFSSPATQAAIEAQAAATPAVTPEVKPEVTPEATPASQEPSTTPETKIDAQASDLDMGTPVVKATEVNADTLKAAGYDEADIITKIKENGGKVPEALRKELEEKFDSAALDAAASSVENAYTATVDMNTYIFESLAKGDATKGKENFTNLSTWCKANMQPAEIAAINHLLTSDNKDVVRQGLSQAVAAWKKGQEKPMMSGDALAVPVKAPEFIPLSRDQFRVIMASKKYNEDPEYAASVDARRTKTMELQGGRGFLTPEYNMTYRPPV
jgi:hypothetical protein